MKKLLIIVVSTLPLIQRAKKPVREDQKKGKKSKNALTPEEQKALGGNRRSEQGKRFSVVPLSFDVSILNQYIIVSCIEIKTPLMLTIKML